MKEELLRFIREDLGAEDSGVNETTSLFKSKLLDSMNLTFLITFVEETYNIKVSAMDVVFENFDSVNNLMDFITRKKQQ